VTKEKEIHDQLICSVNKEGMTTIFCNKNLEDEDLKNKDLFHVTTNTTTNNVERKKLKCKENGKGKVRWEGKIRIK